MDIADSYRRMTFFEEDNRGVFFRLAHVTSSRSAESINISGLLMSNPTKIRNSLFRRSRLKLDDRREVFHIINEHTFCRNFDPYAKSLGIFFYPVTPGFADDVQRMGRAYNEGGEYYRICKDEINKKLTSKGLQPLSPLKAFGVVVVVKLYLQRDASDYLDSSTVATIKNDYIEFRRNRDHISKSEYRIDSNIPKNCIETILRTEEYYRCAGL